VNGYRSCHALFYRDLCRDIALGERCVWFRLSAVAIGLIGVLIRSVTPRSPWRGCVSQLAMMGANYGVAASIMRALVPDPRAPSVQTAARAAIVF